MPGNPQLKVYVDWDADGVIDAVDDVSAYATTRPGAEILNIVRGANLDGHAATPGTATIVLNNHDNRFTPGYTAGPLGSNVVDGRRIRVDAILSPGPTTYPLFVGTVRRITPSTDYPLEATIFADDWLATADGQNVSLGLDETRTLAEFREDLLQLAGLSGSQYVLATTQAEAERLATAADQESLLSVLSDVDNATRSIDFVRPLVSPPFTGWAYVTKTRTVMLASTAVASYSAAQLESIDGWEASDAERINYQLVQAEPYLSAETEELLWKSPRDIPVAAGTSRVKIARWADSVIIGRGRRPAERMRMDNVLTGTVTVTPTYYSNSARLVIAGGASGGEVKRLAIYGYPADPTGLGYEESDASAGGAKYAGAPISSRFLATDSQAKGVGDYITFLGTRTLLARPTVNLQPNLFPDCLVREPGERITVAHGKLALTGQSLIVEGTTLRMTAGGGWRLAMRCRLHPFVSMFTIGGDAAHGIGGTAVLGY